jgi:hypothetical protein
MRWMILLVVLAIGCVPMAEWDWQPTTNQGSQCAHRCNADGHICKAHCLSGWACVAECGMAVTECKAACPDMVRAKIVPEVWNDQDCWRFDICGRGECVAKNGKCVRRGG